MKNKFSYLVKMALEKDLQDRRALLDIVNRLTKIEIRLDALEECLRENDCDDIDWEERGE